MRDLIFISMEDWDEQWRRNQFVCAELARRHPERKILFVGVARNVWRHAGSGDLGTLIKSPVTEVKGFANITVTRPLRVGLERYAWGAGLNQIITRRHVRHLSRQLGLDRPVLWLNPHYAVHMVGRMGESAVIYDITDDWIERDQPAWLAEQVRGQDAELCAKADAVIVCSERLRQTRQSLAAGKLHWIANGVDAEHYRNVSSGSGPLPAASAAWPKPVYGYTGTVHQDRLDVELAAAVARRLRAGSMVFIGPNHLPPDLQRKLLETGRVIFHPAVAYQEVPEYMRAIDVCMVPHRASRFVESLQPIKLWEYLAAGKPIVATDVAGFRDYPELVRIARSAEEFERQLLAAAEEGLAPAEQRRAMARANSWRSRVDEIEMVLEKALAGRRKGEAPCAAPLA